MNFDCRKIKASRKERKKMLTETKEEMKTETKEEMETEEQKIIFVFSFLEDGR